MSLGAPPNRTTLTSGRLVDLPASIQERIEPVPEMGCWLWSGRVGLAGYGLLCERRGDRKVSARAHSAVYKLLRGPVPDGLVLDHLCRVRCCVNPDHLEPVTIRTNVLRGVGIAAKNAQKTECPKCGGPFESLPDGRRKCPSCRRAYMREYLRAYLPAYRRERRARQRAARSRV